jgi:RNA polymerase sigma-B factor
MTEASPAKGATAGEGVERPNEEGPEIADEPEGIDDGATADPEEARSRELFARLPDEEARAELVELYAPLAEYLARRFYGRGEPLEDLIQVASIGLLKSIDRFDPDREVKFSTYATATIVGELKRHFRDKGWALRVPRRLQESGLKVGRAVTDLSQEFGRAPTVAEIGQHTGLSEEEVLEAMDTVHAYTTASLDAPTDEDRVSSLDKLGQEDETFELLDSWTSVAPAIRGLPLRERRILYLRFFRGLTQTQIAQEMGISQMHVSRLLARTLRELREAVEEV